MARRGAAAAAGQRHRAARAWVARSAITVAGRFGWSLSSAVQCADAALSARAIGAARDMLPPPAPRQRCNDASPPFPLAHVAHLANAAAATEGGIYAWLERSATPARVWRAGRGPLIDAAAARGRTAGPALSGGSGAAGARITGGESGSRCRARRRLLACGRRSSEPGRRRSSRCRGRRPSRHDPVCRLAYCSDAQTASEIRANKRRRAGLLPSLSHAGPPVDTGTLPSAEGSGLRHRWIRPQPRWHRLGAGDRWCLGGERRRPRGGRSSGLGRLARRYMRQADPDRSQLLSTAFAAGAGRAQALRLSRTEGAEPGPRACGQSGPGETPGGGENGGRRLAANRSHRRSAPRQRHRPRSPTMNRSTAVPRWFLSPCPPSAGQLQAGRMPRRLHRAGSVVAGRWASASCSKRCAEEGSGGRPLLSVGRHPGCNIQARASSR